MQEQISYINIKSLGFNESEENDEQFFDDYGFQYTIIQLWLSDLIYLEWEKENRLCKLLRIDSKKTMNIMGNVKIKNLNHLIETINFFLDTKLTLLP